MTKYLTENVEYCIQYSMGKQNHRSGKTHEERKEDTKKYKVDKQSTQFSRENLARVEKRETKQEIRGYPR